MPTGAVADGSFVLTNQDTNTSIGLTVESTSQSNGQTKIVLTFTSGTDANGSLVDGNYLLQINGDPRGFDADGSGTSAGTRSISFHRFYADTDGDRDVDATDYGNFFQAFQGNAAFAAALDQDDDDDFMDESGAFFANYGQSLAPFGG